MPDPQGKRHTFSERPAAAPPGTWPRIRILLDEALELPETERAAFVEGRCPDDSLRRQVFSMLAAYAEDSSFLERPFALDRAAAPESPPGLGPGDRLGPYLLLEKKGEGGMGAVYLARRDDASYDKLVAVKLLKRGWASDAEVRRFRVERQILADLEHPSIAKLLDGGSAPGGQPYLVMEYVEGEPLDLYCEERRLPVEERLLLFVEICSAVQFAHQNLIVHRDLKPGNILVDREGRPRLLDFGIAKILEPADFSEQVEPTAAGISPMTPQYASPEQIRGGAITTASDVYSLGVILYRLLTGLPPYLFDSRNLQAVVDAVCQQEVIAPSARLRRAGAREATAAARRLRGDLDAIVLQALAKDPARRYPTAEQLADDLRRHLARLPVRARGNAVAYRAGLFVHRHRLALASALAVFLVLIAAVLVLFDQQGHLIDERNRAVRERNRSETVSSWLVELFTLPDPGRSLGEKVTARELLDKSRASVEKELRDEPELLAALLATLGETYGNLGQLEEARELFAAALALERRHGAGSHQQLSLTLYRLADMLSQQGRFLAARKVAATALEHALAEDAARAAEVPGGESEAVIRSLTLLSYLEFQTGDWPTAAAGFERARRAARAHGDEALLSRVLDYAAEVEQTRGEYDQALADYGEALELRRREKGADHPEAVLLHGKQLALLALREPAAAGAELRAVIARQRKLYGGPHPVLAVTLNNLGLLVLGEGNVAEAERIFAEALATAREVYGASHPTVAAILNNIGEAASRRGDWAAAESAYRSALAVLLEEKGERDPSYALMSSNLGQARLEQGALAEAGGLFARALELTRATVGPNHPQNLKILNNQGQLAAAEGRLEEARLLYREAAAVGRRQRGAWMADLPAVLLNLGATEFGLGDKKAAYASLAEAVRGAASSGNETTLLYATTYLARLDLENGQPSVALDQADRVIAGFAGRPSEAKWILSARRWRGRALLAMGRLEEAEAELRLRLALLEEREASASSLALARKDLEEAAAARRDGGKDP